MKGQDLERSNMVRSNSSSKSVENILPRRPASGAYLIEDLDGILAEETIPMTSNFSNRIDDLRSSSNRNSNQCCSTCKHVSLYLKVSYLKIT